MGLPSSSETPFFISIYKDSKTLLMLWMKSSNFSTGALAGNKQARVRGVLHQNVSLVSIHQPEWDSKVRHGQRPPASLVNVAPRQAKAPASSVNVVLSSWTVQRQWVLGGRKAQEKVSEPAVVFLSLLTAHLLSHTAP